MRAEGDILSLGERPGEVACGGLVWLVDGDERPFEDAPATCRPWLEESSDWAAGKDPEPESHADANAEKPAASEALVWL